MQPLILFIPGLSVLLGIYGYLTKAPLSLPATTDPTDEPTVEVFVPALNEAETIAYALGSVARQSVRPDRVTVVDDGSTDATTAVVEAMQDRLDLEIELVYHADPGSKTKRLKQVTRDSTADKIFVLDADTYLISETYLERVIAAQEAEDVVCSFGVVRPDSRSAKREIYRDELQGLFPDGVPPAAVPEWLERDERGGRPSYLFGRWPVEQYRRVLYTIEQRFFKESQMRLLGTALFPAGCGVLYDRRALRAVFEDFDQSLGTKLTNSEDIFIGFSLVDRGFANVQVNDVSMRTTEPTLVGTVDQTYLWSSSFLQSAFYYRVFSRWLRSSTGDVTDAIQREPNAQLDEEQSVETDGGVENPADQTQTMTNSARKQFDDPSIGVPRPTETPAEEAAKRSEKLSDGSRRLDRRRTLSAIVGSQIVDGFYPTALVIASLLVLLGVLSLELLLAVVAVELTLYVILAGVIAWRQITLTSLLVSIPVRLIQLPVGVYVYARVGTDLLRGKRNWNK